jgi:beta-glucosidase
MAMNAVVDERTLREIYLKGFEIAVKTSDPMTIMTSYNRINGVHSANNYDLCTRVARQEWGFRGFIMTDWSTTNGGGSNAAKCIRAGNDLIMPGKDSDIQEIIDAVEGRRLPVLAEEKLDESIVRLIAAALVCEENRQG